MGRADPQRPRLLLGLPAPGQPRPGRDRRRPALREGGRRRGRHRRCCGSSASGSTGADRRTTPSAGGPCSTSGATPWTWAAPGWSCWTTGAAGCSSPARRAMLPAGEWSWFLDQAHGVYDHLVVGSSLPWLLPPGIHHVEAWNEQLADSGRPWVAALAEKLRRALDLEHWAAFRRSFDALGELFGRLGSAAPAHPATGSAPAPPTRHRRRSACSPATCTTRTWPGPGSTTRRWRPRCTSSPARRSTTRCRRRCAR